MTSLFKKQYLLVSIISLGMLFCLGITAPADKTKLSLAKPLYGPVILYEVRAAEVGFPDTAIVALMDVQSTNLNKDPLEELHADCVGTITRFISGSDQNKKIEFQCAIDGDGFFIKPDNYILDAYAWEDEYMAMVPFCRDILIIYERKKDGGVNIFRLFFKGLEVAPVFEWLENTKNRKADRLPLAVLILMDKNVPPQLMGLAYRQVIFSNLSFESRFEILRKACEVATTRDGPRYGIGLMSYLDKENTKEQNIELIHYYLKRFAASTDVRDVFWAGGVDSIVRIINAQKKATLYTDVYKEIADAVKKHQLSDVRVPLEGGHDPYKEYERGREYLLKEIEDALSAPAPGSGAASAPPTTNAPAATPAPKATTAPAASNEEPATGAGGGTPPPATP